METEERVVARLVDGNVVKGYVKKFDPESDVVNINETGSGKVYRIPLIDLKALFFIKSFEGDSEYREKKAFGIRENRGRKVYVKFKDQESLIGFIEGAVPWDKGFFLSNNGSGAKGFFLLPVDDDSNNVKVFVVGTSAKDVTVMAK